MKESLLYRRQFIIGENIDNKLGWNKTNLSRDLVLYNHEDLEIKKVGDGEKKLILLGYILDPDHPSRSNKDILTYLIENSSDFATMKDLTISLGGRWLIIYDSFDELKILTDPSSLRRLFYTKEEDLLIGSSMAIINYYKKQNLDSDKKLKKYLNSKHYKLTEGEWYIDKTIYKNIYKVLPNRYLDVLKRDVNKFWIDICNKSYDENIKRVAEILVNEIKSLNNRTNNIINSISAGIDSRIMYAASKKANIKIKGIVSTMNILTDKSADIYIPKKIFKDYGDELIVLDRLEDFKEDFLEYYEKSIENARKLPKNLTIQKIFDSFKNPYVITGNNAEVIVHYYDKDDAENGAEISKLLGIDKSIDYFNEYFDKWIEDARLFLEEHKDIVPMKLFHWEQDTGNWGTLYQAESDIASEEFPPFNNREIFLRLWQASRERKYSKQEVYKDLLRLLDENLLTYPINPLSTKEKLREFLRSHISHTAYVRLKNILKA